MSSSDDERGPEDDDPQLRSLRAVWVTMREEEPSDRGLAALMAAARTQADALKPTPSWWQRTLAVLRRPPVLALATVTVLLGGALVMTRNSDKLASPEPAAPTSVLDDHERAPGGGDQGMASTPMPTPPALPPPADKTTVAAPDPVPPPVQRKRPAPPPKTMRGPTQQAPRDTGVSGGLAFGGERQTKAPTAHADNASDRADDMAGSAPPMEPTMETMTADAAPARRAGPSIDQLVKQCEMAAARGDCNAVRTLAKEIAKSDPGAYKAKVAKSAAVARCLE